MKRICVIGSLNTDLVAGVERFPKPGETLTGKDFGTYPGGKGANQAVAAGRLGADVLMVGKLGADLYGEQYLQVLKNEGVRTEGVAVEAGVSSGIAVIEVDSSGENHIVIIAGANGMMDQAFIDQKLKLMRECHIFLLQLEIPLDTVLYAVKRLKELGKTVILDPAPAMALPDEIYPFLDYITPNETEIRILTGQNIESEEDLKRAGMLLIEKGAAAVIAKAGRKGAYIINKNEFMHIPGYRVQAVDTTAAGDSFNAGLAYALAEDKPLNECVRFANAVGALSTTAKGAQTGMPDLDRVQMLMDEQA